MILLAEMTDIEHVLQITRDTIAEIYSHYYADDMAVSSWILQRLKLQRNSVVSI